MKKDAQNSQKQKAYLRKQIGITGMLSIIGVLSIVLDVVLGLEIKVFGELAKILFNLVVVVAGIWVTCYLLFLQIYRDSYPLKIINEEYLPQLKEYFTYALFSVVYGAVVITKNSGWIENIFFVAVALFVIVSVLLNTYRCSKSLMVNTYIDEFCKDIQKQLNSSQVEIDYKLLENISRVLDESLVKEEYYIVQNITKGLGEIFLGFLKNSIDMIDNGVNEKDVENNFNKILEIYVFELKMCAKISSQLVIDDITNQNIENIRFCIKSKQYEWFKEYITQINRINFKMQKDGKESDIAIFDIIFKQTIKELIAQEKTEWLMFLIEEIFCYAKSLNFIDENKNLKQFANILTNAMHYSLRKEKFEIYEKLFESFKQLTMILCKVPKGFSDILVYYTMLFNNLKGRNCDRLERFIDVIFEITDIVIDDSKLVEFKFYCISEIENECNETIREEVKKYHINTLMNTIEMKENYKGYLFIPDFEKRIIDNQYQLNVIDEVCRDISCLLNKCIVCGNLLSYFSFLNVLNGCLDKTESKHKDIQCKLFDIYISFINRTARLKNRQFMEILFSQLEDELRKMDKLRNVSNDFAFHIINSLTGCARYGEYANNIVVLYIVDLISELMKENNEIYFVSNSVDKKKALYRGLFNIGTCCIENDFEEGVRRVSNTLGWFIIYNIKQGIGSLIIYLIERAWELYVLSKRMDISSKTQTFLLTLFTTVGTYCCKDNKNGLYLHKIIDYIKNEDKERVNTAVKLRTSENDMWNDLFENQTEMLTRKFLKQYEKVKG